MFILEDPGSIPGWDKTQTTQRAHLACKSRPAHCGPLFVEQFFSKIIFLTEMLVLDDNLSYYTLCHVPRCTLHCRVKNASMSASARSRLPAKSDLFCSRRSHDIQRIFSAKDTFCGKSRIESSWLADFRNR